jgi:sulfur carrier protein
MKVKKFSTNFFFNGESYNILSYKIFNIEDLIKFFNYKQNLVVVEYNSKILHPQNWRKIFLKNNDRIELVTIVGGG